MNNSLTYLVAQLLLKNKIPFDKEELSFQIQSHPSYPSLHAITGVLDHFNIENIAADVPINVETLLELPNCFIAQINSNKGKELVVLQRKKLDYFLFSSSKKKEKITEKEFLSKFTGIIVGVEKPEIQEKTASKKVSFSKIALGFSISLLIGLIALNTYSFQSISYLILAIIGVFISISIVQEELGVSTPLGNAFCGDATEKKDCDAVLSSKGAKIIGNYKLSDLSLLYFSGLLIATVFAMVFKPSLFNGLFFISLFAIPITFYSIYYQYKIVKKWCLLCLSIVGVLWLQAGVVFIDKYVFTSIPLENSLLIALSFLSIFSIWSFLKPLISNNNTLKKEKIEFVKFKRNFTLFESLLNKSATVHTQLPQTHEIVFGNPAANLEIIIITNPFCGHCKPVHTLVDDILHKYNNEVKIIIRFSVNTKDLESNGVNITTRLLEIYHTKGTKECLQAMSSIYGGQQPATWLQEWGNCKEKTKFITVLENQSTWCKDNSINFTPEILINGKSYPKEYNRPDLLFFIEELAEQCTTPVNAQITT